MIRTLAQLTKAGIAFASSLSAVTGYLMAADLIGPTLLTTLLGTWLTASGAGALNQVQECDIDAKMLRTRNRPIPSGRLTRLQAFAIAALLIASGTLILWIGVGPRCGMLGLLAVLWYNGIYTNLKRVTRFAVIPGAVIGMIPPMIGWLAGDGSPWSQAIWLVMGLFFIWQIPHFWLLQLLYREDLARAGMPHIFEKFSPRQVSRITFAWILAMVAMGMMFPLFGLIRHTQSFTIAGITSLGMVAYSLQLVRPRLRQQLMDSMPLADASFRRSFSAINLFILLMQMVLVFDSEIQRYML